MRERHSPLYIKNFLAAQRHATLATHSQRLSGFPFGSVVPYDFEPSGSMIIYVATIAEHYRNLMENDRACITVADSFAGDDPQAHMRVSVMGHCRIVSDTEREQVGLRYEQRFPGSIRYELAHSFRFARLTPVRIRWIGGFGAMGWLDGSNLAELPFDEISYRAEAIISHLNDDHRDALQAFARAHGTEPQDVRAVAAYADGLTIRARDGKDIDITFPQPVATLESYRQELIAMLQSARSR